jgi:hypothetical protein
MTSKTPVEFYLFIYFLTYYQFHCINGRRCRVAVVLRGVSPVQDATSLVLSSALSYDIILSAITQLCVCMSLLIITDSLYFLFSSCSVCEA